MSMVLDKTKTLEQIAQEVLDIEANAILKLKERVGNDFAKAIDIIYNCKGRIIITGMGKSGHIGRKIAATLTSTGTPSYFLHPAESTHGDSGIITRQDVVIAISNSGETAELLNLLPLIKRFGVPLIAMTGKLNSTLSQKADVTLDISIEREACPLGKAPTTSTTATLAMGDALAICLLQKRGFTEEDFLLFHPSGALGKGILYKATDLMIKDEKLPVVDDAILFRDAIKIISDKKLGCVIVVNKNGVLVGILTDGDIRRTLMKFVNIENLTVKDVMTVNPKTVQPDELAAKALAVMEKYSITSLVVVDEHSRPIGLLHVHELLKAGVA